MHTADYKSQERINANSIQKAWAGLTTTTTTKTSSELNFCCWKRFTVQRIMDGKVRETKTTTLQPWWAEMHLGLNTMVKLKAGGYSSRIPHQAQHKLRTRIGGCSAHRLAHTGQMKTGERSIAWWVSISCRCYGQILESTAWTHGLSLPYVNRSAWRWLCNGVENVFLAPLGPLNTN